MDSRQFQAMQAQVQQMLVELTGKRIDELRQMFDRCTSLADCLAIIEARGNRMRRCPIARVSDCTATASFMAFNAIAAASAAPASTR
ncbi:hypothetical protein C9I28_08715 [Pseudoduganella armeniaca]|uniref:Uncharacterized protein n=1 Tax=Pseudoduganella armeniaca TaxID=2072590 RepID=A0A2R4C8A9_9BURK|nr:hypothetical protein [Pseudoduganella armeniaca]AVR95800.1 hypothetical protein C9I28_08715 [Pseudoduganella armeniaca]